MGKGGTKDIHNNKHEKTDKEKEKEKGYGPWAINHIRKRRHKSCKLGSNVDTAINQSARGAGRAPMQQLIR